MKDNKAAIEGKSYLEQRLVAAESFAYMMMMNLHKDLFDDGLKLVYEYWQKLITEAPASPSPVQGMDEKDLIESFAEWIASYNKEGDGFTLVDGDWYWDSDTDGDQPLTAQQLYDLYKKKTTISVVRSGIKSKEEIYYDEGEVYILINKALNAYFGLPKGIKFALIDWWDENKKENSGNQFEQQGITKEGWMIMEKICEHCGGRYHVPTESQTEQKLK